MAIAWSYGVCASPCHARGLGANDFRQVVRELQVALNDPLRVLHAGRGQLFWVAVLTEPKLV